MSFKSFLIEAQFSEDDFSRLLGAVEKRMPKLLGAKLRRFGGPSGIEKVAGADGYLYFLDGKKKAFRVRAKAGKVIAIDIWNEYRPDQGPSFVADVSQLSASTILGAMREIANIIKSPSAGEINVKLEEALMEMATRVEPSSFYKMVVDMYGAEQAKDLTWEQIKTVADQNDVLIPAYIRAQKTGRGKWTSVPAEGADAAAAAPKEKKDPILYIKVTAQDPDTKKFIATSDSKEAQRLYGQLQAALDGPPTEAEVKDPDTLYGHLAQLVELACKGSLRSLLIYGGPGTGKTYTIMQTIKKMGFTQGVDYVKLSGKASPISIYETLFMYRDGGLIIFDDLDSMWRNEDASNILKAALDTSPVREISWSSANTINVSKMTDSKRKELFAQIDRQINGDDDIPEDDEDEDDDDDGRKKKPAKSQKPVKIKYPSSFDFTGRVIFISNLKREEFDTAIMSRSAKINMDLTPAEILQRMKKILPTLGGDDVSIEQKQELLDHLLEMHKKKEITAVTMREFTKGLDIVRSGVSNWKELIQYS